MASNTSFASQEQGGAKGKDGQKLPVNKADAAQSNNTPIDGAPEDATRTNIEIPIRIDEVMTSTVGMTALDFMSNENKVIAHDDLMIENKNYL